MKVTKIYKHGFIKIRPSNNNIFVTITDNDGKVLFKSTAGLIDFQGSKKRTPYVASQVMKDVMDQYFNSSIQIKLFILEFRGFIQTSLIKTMIKQLNKYKMNNIFYLSYINKRAHNGVRLKKQRRI